VLYKTIGGLAVAVLFAALLAPMVRRGKSQPTAARGALDDTKPMTAWTPSKLKEFEETMRHPTGGCFFPRPWAYLMNAEKRGFEIFRKVAGQQFSLIERTDDLILQFYHSAPATGTRVAKIPLKEFAPCGAIGICITWAPSEINLRAGPMGDASKVRTAVGGKSKIGYRISTDGSVIQIGSENVEVLPGSEYKNGKPTLQPTAIEAWQNTKKAVEVLGMGTSTEALKCTAQHARVPERRIGNLQQSPRSPRGRAVR